MDTNINLSDLYTAEAGLLQSMAYRALRKFLTGYLQEYAISMSEWALLGLLCRRPDGLTLSDAAQQLAVALPLATKLSNNLESKELIARTTSPADRRVKTIRLSRRGKKFFETTEADLRIQMRVFLSGVTADELAIYIKVLAKIAAKA